MKKIVRLVLILSLVSFNVDAQDSMNKFSTSPIQLFVFGLNNIEYERGFNEGKFGVSFFGARSGQSVPTIGGYKFYGAEQNFSFKVYTRNFKKSSFWYGGKLSLATGNIIYDYDFSSLDFEDEEYQKYIENRAVDISTLGLTGILGYQFIIKSFYLDFFGGIGYAFTNNLFGDAEFMGEVEESSVLLTYGLRTGIIF